MIAVMTAPRAGTSYLAQTLADVDQSATHSRVVVSDSLGHRPDVPEPWLMFNFAKPRGGKNENRWAMWKAFELAAEIGEDLVLLEDDIRMCANGARYLERFPVPGGVGFVSFFAPFGERMPYGLWRGSLRAFSYAQCLKFSSRRVAALARGYHEMAGGPHGGADIALRAFGERRGWTYSLHIPSIVQHVGDVSAVDERRLGDRTSPTFPGVDFRAMGLPCQAYERED